MHIRCPHCGNPIEVVDDTSLAEIDCPSCGSSFSLIGDDTTQTHRPATRRLAHFELVRELGIGKFGSVWMARDTELDRTVAIKIPRKGALDSEESELFLRDARAAAQLNHPHIVGVHEVGREEDTLYIVSDYVEGANLREWLSGHKLSFRESAELVVKVAEALEHAHQAGVVHRDMKPGNIMMDHDGQPHLIDFGLAKRDAGEITMTVDGHILGTPAYMSPEQARGRGHEADARSDVYSLGVILFELLTGELPFRGDAQMLIVQIQRDEPPPLRKLNARIPRDLETITLKCLEKEPVGRYRTAHELADDLKRCLHGQAIMARPVGRAERAWRWIRRNPVVARPSAAIVLVLALGTVVSAYFAAAAIAQSRIADRRAEEAIAQSRLAQEAQSQMMLADQHAAAAVEAQRLAEESADQAEGARKRENLLISQSSVVAVGPNHLLATVGRDANSVTIWKTNSGTRLYKLVGHQAPITCISFCGDGQRLATGSKDRTVCIWDLTTGKQTHVLHSHSSPIASVAFDLDGLRLYSASSAKVVKTWDSRSGALLRTFKQ